MTIIFEQFFVPKAELYQEAATKNKSKMVTAHVELTVHRTKRIKQRCRERSNHKELKIP